MTYPIAQDQLVGFGRHFSTQAEALQNYFFLKPQSDSANQVNLIYRYPMDLVGD